MAGREAHRVAQEFIKNIGYGLAAGTALPQRLPDRIGAYMGSLRRVYPAARQTLWGGDEVRSLIAREWRWRKAVSTVSNSLIWSQPRRPELALAIERIAAHCRQRYYGDDPVDVTGPRVPGYACAAAATDRWRGMLPDDRYRGVHEAPGLETDLPSIAREDERRVIALRPRRSPGDWSGAGLGTNDYQAMWRSRDIYVCTGRGRLAESRRDVMSAGQAPR